MSDSRRRLRVRYSREGRLAYLGQLELIRTIERCVRRSRLPFSVSKGFSPHMRIAYSQALPVGTTSAAEYFDLVLEGPVELPEALASLVSSMPGDIAPDAVGYVALKEPSLASWLTRARWQVDISSEGSIAGLLAALERVAAAPTLSYERAGRPRTISLSTTLASSEVLRTSELEARLELVTRSGDFAGLRPQALVAAAAREAATEVFLRTRRCAQWHDEAGAPLDPLDPSLLLAPAVTGL